MCLCEGWWVGGTAFQQHVSICMCSCVTVAGQMDGQVAVWYEANITSVIFCNFTICLSVILVLPQTAVKRDVCHLSMQIVMAMCRRFLMSNWWVLVAWIPHRYASTRSQGHAIVLKTCATKAMLAVCSVSGV